MSLKYLTTFFNELMNRKLTIEFELLVQRFFKTV